MSDGISDFHRDQIEQVHELPTKDELAESLRKQLDAQAEELARVMHAWDDYRHITNGQLLDCKQELARVTAILNRCTGALVDAGTVPTEDIEAGIRALIQERAQARAAVGPVNGKVGDRP